MRRKRQAYTVEFKLQAVRLANESGRPIGQIARELGIRPDVLGRWRREFDRERPGLQANGAAVGSPEEEIRRLQREVAILREEREILKKATAFFAKDAR
jgi:transposase